MIDFPLARLRPQPAAVYAALGLKSGRQPSPGSATLLQKALAVFDAAGEARGLSLPVTAEEFADIFSGLGLNAPGAPLGKIFPRADQLHLFVFTLGERISAEIQRLFAGDDFALGSVLDAVASLAADQAGRVVEAWAEDQANQGRGNEARHRAFLYSPGYCGWHISAQEKLFAFLCPEKIGVRLNERFLMTPLKSISGVLVAGPAPIHQVSEAYPFCAQCKSPACREREMGQSA
ncbi:MAG TPA: vitamin B12 dependent-methionine synthase activation domain-containing protein [Acidobacteriota bacterium]